MAVAIQPTDFDVIDQLIAGNSQAIEMLYDRYARLAFGVALKILGERTAAEDVVQEAFVAVWRNAAAFDPARGQIRSWLLRIVRNRAIDRLRANPAYRQSADIETANLSVKDVAFDHVAMDAERQQLRHVLSALPQTQRRAIELSYFGGLSQTEVASRMHLPLGTVKSRMRLGLEKMRVSLRVAGVL